MSKNRFYIRAMDHLKNDESNIELVGDISDYVKNLEFERAILAHELGRANTIGGRIALSSVGFNVDSGVDSQ